MSTRPPLDLAGGPTPDPAPGPAPGPGPGGPPRPPSRFRIVPTLAMIALVLVLAALYVPVRMARTSGEPERVDALGQERQLPAGWKDAQQKDAGGGERWAFGPKGATREALFVTRSELKRTVDGDEDVAVVRGEVRRSLRATGAPQDVARDRDAVQVDGEAGDAYAFQAGGLEIRQIYVTKGKTLWAFSCQYRPGNERVAQGCTDIIATWQLER